MTWLVDLETNNPNNHSQILALMCVQADIRAPDKRGIEDNSEIIFSSAVFEENVEVLS